MKTAKRTLLLLSVTLIFFACKKEGPDKPFVNITPPPKLGFIVVNYFPDYREVTEYPDRMYRMSDVINFAFANVNASHQVTLPNPAKLNALYQKAKSNGAKVFLSINGTSSVFASMSSTAGGRLTFTEDVMRKVRQYNLDGIDVDWEYPQSNNGTAENFSLLIKQLSDSLHVDGKYYLTAAITPGIYSGSIRDGIRNDVFQNTDWLNVMVYDDFSTNPSDPYRQHSPYNMATTSIDYWTSTRGMPKDKFILGIPAYGRAAGITQSGTALAYKTILLQGGSPASDSATVTAGGFANYTIYYNGQPTVKRKAALAKSKVGGIMFWEMGQDANDDRSLIKAACDTLGIVYN